MYVFTLIAFLVMVAIPLGNAYNTASVSGDNKYRYLAGIFSLSVLAGGYYIYFDDHYLDSLSGMPALLAGLLACGWLVTNLLMFLPLLLIRLLSIFGGRKYWRVLVGVLWLVAIGIGTYGAVDGGLTWTRERLTLQYHNLPKEMDGLKIALLADTHIGPYYRVQDLREQLEDAKLEKADYVIIAGDLIDDVRVLPEMAAVLREEAPKFRHGIDFVWGNHEYYRGREKIEAALKTTPVRILRNSHGKLTWAGKEIYIAGVDFPFKKGAELTRQIEDFTTRAIGDIPQDAFLLLIAHHPDFIDAGYRHQADLTVAGHSHGGQVAWQGKSLMPLYKYNMGEFRQGDMVGYVSRGSGHWFPFRFQCPREVTYITLRSAGKGNKKLGSE